MSIEFAILGLLSLRPLTGYDIKKIFSGTAGIYYSDNNNQVYRTLVNLHQESSLTREIIYQEDHPPRKVYHITDSGREKLDKWVRSEPHLPQLKNPFIIQLAWADSMEKDDLVRLLIRYEEDIQTQLIITRRQLELKADKIISESYIQLSLARTKREAYIWKKIQENWVQYYENELAWIQNIRLDLINEPENGSVMRV